VELETLGEALRAAAGPVLGICAGMQLQAVFAGGAIAPSPTPEHGYAPIEVDDRGGLLSGLPTRAVVFHDHDDEIVSLPDGFRVIASSTRCAIQAIADLERRWWGTQFHPEEWNTTHPDGEAVLRRFFELAGP
jgi:GMP synthase (glutamine-hydrolysing)